MTNAESKSISFVFYSIGKLNWTRIRDMYKFTEFDLMQINFLNDEKFLYEGYICKPKLLKHFKYL